MVMQKKIGLGVAMALFLSTAAAQAGVQEGVEAWRNGDYAQAIAEWQPLAESGDPDAQFNLGQAYKLGRGVPQDMERAGELFGSAARQGHLQAEANYGLIQFQNGNREDAMPWIIRAANRGEPRAQYIYGTALFNGDLAPRDWPRAYAMMTNASAAGLPQAAASMGQMDQYIPLDQRQEGTELAAQLNAENPTIEVAVAPPVPASVPVPTPSISREPVVPPSPTPPTAPPPASPPPASPPAASPPIATQPRPQPTAPVATPARTGPWRIQLGSFRERARAENHWRSLNGRVSEISGLQPFLVRAGPYTRLQAGPFATRAEAQRACAAAVRAGSDCITVRRQ